MPVRCVVYGPGGFDSSAPDGNVVERFVDPDPPVEPDRTTSARLEAAILAATSFPDLKARLTDGSQPAVTPKG